MPHALLSFTLLSISFVAGCGASTPHAGARADSPTPHAEPASPARPEVSEAAECAALPRTDCMAARHCALVAIGGTSPEDSGYRSGDYRCRPVENRCEEAITQWDLPGGGSHISSPELADEAIAACTNQPGCDYVPHDCYCSCQGYGQTEVADGDEAPQCLCACAGGSPPACSAGTADQNDDDA